MKFADDTTLRAVANNSEDNTVINKPAVVKNTKKEKRKRYRICNTYMTAIIEYAHLMMLHESCHFPPQKGDLSWVKYKTIALCREEIPCPFIPTLMDLNLE